MKLVKGNKQTEFSKEDLLKVQSGFNSTVIDLGTGDGRFVYENAVEDPGTLYIGVDPSPKQMEVYSKKAQRNHLPNVLFVTGSIELLPGELTGSADKVFVLLPWGSLLQSIVNPQSEAPSRLSSLLKPGGVLEMLFGYAHDAEPAETQRLSLPKVDRELLEDQVIPYFEQFGFRNFELSELNKDDLLTYPTTWSKRLRFGKERPLFYIKMLLPAVLE